VFESGTSGPPAPDYWIGVELRNVPDPSPPGPTKLDKLAKTLAGGYVFVAFILTLIGGLQGGLERLLINHPWQFVIGLLLLGAGVAIAFVDAYLIPGDQPPETEETTTADGDDGGPRRQPRELHIWKLRARWTAVLRVVLMGAALAAFVVGLWLLVDLGTQSVSASERPAISTTASVTADGSKIEGHVAAFGVKSSQWIYLTVNGFRLPPSQESDGSLSSNETGGKRIHLYQTRAGPDRSGKVDVSFTIPVLFGRFSFVRVEAKRASNADDETVNPCFLPEQGEGDQSRDQSCATVYSPQPQARPTLNATWEKGAQTNTFSISVKATGADPNAVVLLVITNGVRGGPVFYRSILTVSATGALDASAKVPVPVAERNVCVVATSISATDTTTLKAQSQALTCSVRSFNKKRASFAVFRLPKPGSPSKPGSPKR